MNDQGFPEQPLVLESAGALAAMSDLPADRGLPVIAGDVRIMLHRWQGAVVAYVNRCPHMGTPLDLVPGRLLSADGRHFVCSTHYALFDPATGLCIKGPCRGRRLQPVRINVRDGQIVPA